MDHLTRFRIGDDRADSDGKFEALTVVSGLVASQAVLSTLCFKGVIETKFKKGIFVRIGNQINFPPTAAITAAGAAFGNEFLAPECNASVATVPGFYGN